MLDFSYGNMGLHDKAMSSMEGNGREPKSFESDSSWQEFCAGRAQGLADARDRFGHSGLPHPASEVASRFGAQSVRQDPPPPATGHDLGPRADFGAILAIHRFQLALRLGGRRKPASTTSQRRSRGIRYGEMSPTPLLLRLGAYQSEQMNDLWHLDFHHGKIRLPRPACQSRSRRPSDWMAEAISGNREFFAPVSSFM